MEPALLDPPCPDGLQRRAGLTGTQRRLRWQDGTEDVALRLIEGRLDGQAAAACRLTLDGPAASVGTLAASMAAGLDLQVPRATLAAVALAGVAGVAPPPRAKGAPEVAEGLTVGESLAAIMGHLLDVMLSWADAVPKARTPEPVHQMRVATRRLRSALSIYKGVAACPEVTALLEPLKLCAARLGTARDWDVFLDGTGRQLAEAFPGDVRCTAMLRAAARRRRVAYAELRAFIGSPEFRTLTVGLACAAALRPWEYAEDAGVAGDTATFAAGVLRKRLKQVRHAGRGLEALSVPALHELRKDCKRLRYAAEFFASLFPGKRARRFLDKLSDLQEELGLLNDGAAVTGLMAQLGRPGRSYAAGLVEGFSAAHAEPARARIGRAWKRFRTAEPFWPT